MNDPNEQLTTTTEPTAEASSVKESEAPRAVRRPRYSVRQGDEAYEVGVALPGVRKDEVQISFEDSQLVLEATPTGRVPGDWKPLYRELPEADYRLVLDVNFDVNSDGISARMEDGVLSLRLPIAEAAKPKRIAIN